jgi:hypothetical protein
MLNYPNILIKNGRRQSLTGRTLWCGPFLVAMVTGLDYDTAYKKVLSDLRRSILAARKKKYAGREHDLKWSLKVNPLPTVVKGTYEHQIARVLGKLGVTTKLVYTGPMAKRPTLLTFAREHTVKGHTYVVVAGHHWVTIKDGVLYHAWHAPMLLEDAKRWKMARVECWADVKPRPAAVQQQMAEAA